MTKTQDNADMDAPAGAAMVSGRDGGALVAVAQQREIAEVQAAMILARSNPRDEKAAQDRILMACTRPVLAEKAMYAYSRGGTEVTGASIRLAEVLAQNWGNFDFGIRELDQRDGESTVEAYAWDLETNVRQRKVFQVPHIRYSRKKGNVALSDPRDIYEMVANQGARRLRACILGVIPGDVQDAAVRQCETTLASKAEVTPERLKALLEKFQEFSVTKEMIERRMQRHLDAMTPALLIQFGKIYNSLKDGMSSPADWFAAPSGEKGKLSEDDLRPAKAPNRGHGNENLDKAARTMADRSSQRAAEDLADKNGTKKRTEEGRPEPPKTLGGGDGEAADSVPAAASSSHPEGCMCDDCQIEDLPDPDEPPAAEDKAGKREPVQRALADW